MTSEKILIIDEAMDQDITPDYDLLQDTSFNMEDLIEIKTKKLPGKKDRFNNKPDVATQEVIVTGLVLHFSQDISDSKLSSILGREDIEHLFLYADTIIINNKLEFPQANVTITCRCLIIEEQGSISTTPRPHAQLFAVGSGGDNRIAGEKGESAGDITLLCGSFDNRHKSEPVFLLNGGKGQDGEMGELKKVPSPDYPLSWSKIESTVLKYDAIPGETKNWFWPDFNGIEKEKIYYVSLYIWNNFHPVGKSMVLETTLGDSKLENLDNGADAIASGPGGYGGNGGTLSYLRSQNFSRSNLWSFEPGPKGISTEIEGGKKAKNSTYYHLYLKVFHDSGAYNGEYKKKDGSFKEDHRPQCYYTKTIASRDGKSAKGKDGRPGLRGKAKVLPTDKNSWLHPLLLELMLGYAKTNFRDGERWKAKWILERYNTAISTLPASLKDGMHMSSLIREMELYLRRLNQNLDFYGYPPGWVPKLSALSNLEIMVKSRRDLAQLIYFADRLLKSDEANTLEAKDLDRTVKVLKDEIKTAQTKIVDAFKALGGVKNSIFEMEREVAERFTEMRNLRNKILEEIKDKQKAQAIFTGCFKIAAGICSFIPVGQPFVGQLGGNILNKVSEIDIDSDNPVKEGLSFAGKLSGEIGGYIEKNKEKIKTDVTSGLTKEIESGTKELSATKSDIADLNAKLAEAEASIKSRFSDRDISFLVTESRKLNPADNDYAGVIAEIDKIKLAVSSASDIELQRKTEITTKLLELKEKKQTLAEDLKKHYSQKEQREKKVDRAGKVIKGFTDGISGISSGIQSMMVEFDENDPEVKAEMEKMLTSKYKEDFESINKKITEINKRKLPLVEALLRLERDISQGVQRISSNMVQWSVLNDQRVSTIQHGLQPATRACLKRIRQESWDLMMLECYYMTKSYQYRFLKKIAPQQHGIQQFIEDIDNFSKGNGSGPMTENAYRELFDLALKSQFKRLASDLLVTRQMGIGTIDEELATLVIDSMEKNSRSEPILHHLNTHGSATFRLVDISSAMQGTDSWKYYRIKNIEFESVNVESPTANISFSFGLRHSGDSLIRNEEGNLYYFTSRSSRKDLAERKANAVAPPLIDLQVHSWNATYSGANRSKDNKGLTNAVRSTEDDVLLDKLLTNFDLKDEYEEKRKPYKDHYPGASSELMLTIYDDGAKRNYKITGLTFTVTYEVSK